MGIHAYHLAPLSEALYYRLESDDLRHRGWRFAIYHALRSSVDGSAEPVYWKTEYRQWSVDHHYRGSRHSAKSRITDCRLGTMERIDADHIKMEVFFTLTEGSGTSESIQLCRQDFHASLWLAQDVNGETLLEGTFERDRIFDGLSSGIQGNGPAAALPASTEPIDLHPKMTALHAMTDAMRAWYSQASAEEQAYLETVFGAAVFYLPQSVDHFSGYISLECLRGCLTDERRVKDHIYPRKRAGRHLLTTGFTAEHLHGLYHGELARFMYLTPSENSKMVNYYENYEDHDRALEALGIVKFPSGGRDAFCDHTEFRDFLKYLQRVGINTLKDLEAAERALDAFRAGV
jgi:hypothetical protein